MKTGSYPKPPSPLSSEAMTPETIPSATVSEPSGQRTRTTVRNLARRCGGVFAPASSSSLRSFAIFATESLGSPAYRADRTPGAPFRASTSRPVSSASEAAPVAFAIASALRRAFPSSVSAFSSTSGTVAGRGSRTTPHEARISSISLTLSGFALAQTRRRPPTVLSPDEAAGRKGAASAW
ncbi:unannotated protein [freshwater metagenome]|uniref:Unannotated protein n=1 Tax=freshwater metagenome TaxID=449393 RepID=A0A6J6NW11_9ZZZZ